MKTSTLTLAAALAGAAMTVFAQAPAAHEGETPEQRHYRLRGGDIERPDSFKGKVAFVDTQSRVAFTNIELAAGTLMEATGCNIVAAKSAAGKPEEFMKSLDAAVVVVVVDDETTPAMLVAPEDHWGVVNVAKLVDDLPTEKAKTRFIGSRTTKEIIRAFSLLCGGGSSQFPGNMMNATSLRKLDTTVDSIPVDMVGYYQEYLKTLGVTVRAMTNYKTACREGWAPAPTNDVQKAIWDKVHAMPTEPLKIKPETKKQDK
jgi:hypothetical protein